MFQVLLDLKKSYLSNFINYLTAHAPNLLSTIFAYELENEISMTVGGMPFNSMTGCISAATQNPYLPSNPEIPSQCPQGTYDMSIPAHRQQLEDDSFVNYSIQMSSLIKSLDPQAMVTISVFSYFASGKSGANGLMGNFTDPRYPARPWTLVGTGLSYVDFHLYPAFFPPATSYSMANELASSELQIFDKTRAALNMGEFGAYESDYPDATTACAALTTHLKEAYQNGFSGNFYWTWDTYIPDPAAPSRNTIWNASEDNGAINGCLAPSINQTLEPDAPPIGYIDKVGAYEVVGWTCDPDNWTIPITVSLYEGSDGNTGGTLIMEATANSAREPAVGAACGNGSSSHGFVFDLTKLPAGIQDGQVHTVYVNANDIDSHGATHSGFNLNSNNSYNPSLPRTNGASLSIQFPTPP
jgi:hypothetical protein